MKLSVVLATRNEIPMLMMTVLSAIEQIKADGINGEVFIVDNSDPEYWPAVQAVLAGQIKDKMVRLVREEEPSIAVALDRAHREANGEFLFYTDAHTLIGAGTFKALLTFFEENPDKPIGYLHSPIQWAHASSGARRAYFGLGKTLMGSWSGAKLLTEPSKVTWKGMPYVIRKTVYEAIGGLGCCAEHRLGWGVMYYMGIKPWLFGYENWAIPEGVSYHFGQWPEAARALAPYRTYSKSGERRIGVSLAAAPYVLGGSDLVAAEFSRMGLDKYFPNGVGQCIAEVREVAEKDRQWVLQNQKLSFQELLDASPWGELTKPVATITPQYRSLNQRLHADESVKYGYKGHEQADQIKEVVGRFRLRTLLDYGAGKQTLSQALQGTPNLRVSDYDPAISAIAHAPKPADIVVCTDVLEHVEPECLEEVLADLWRLAKRYLYVRVCTVPCTSKALPDGSDPHRIVQPFDWWKQKLLEKFTLKDEYERSEKYFTLLLKK